MSAVTADILDRFARLESGRATWESHWQSLADLMLPRRADFTSERVPGERRTSRQYDGTPMLAARSLASSIDSLLKPKNNKWIFVKCEDEDVGDDHEVKAWLTHVEDRIRAAIYNPKSRFLQASAEVDLDLVVLGTGVLYVDESRDLQRLSFRALPLKHVYGLENSSGHIDTVNIRWPMTARQASQWFGEVRVGPLTREAMKDGRSPDRVIEHIQCIRPTSDGVMPGRGAFPWESLWVERESGHLVHRAGYHEMPVMIPRWDTAAGEFYGRSPGMTALPDAETLMQMGKTLLAAGQKAVDPPLFLPRDGVIGATRMYPGGLNYYDSDAVGNAKNSIWPLEVGANIPLGREMQNDVRQQIWDAFFKNVLALPVDGPQMTATEIIERKEQFIRTIGPVFGRLEADYTAPLVERSFGIMFRAGAFMPPPDILRGRDIRFEYSSPVERVRKQMDAMAGYSVIERLGPLVQANPGILDIFDMDEIARGMAEAGGMDMKWMRAPAQVGEMRAERAKQQQAEARIQGAERLAGGAATAAKALPLLDRMMGGEQGMPA